MIRMRWLVCCALLLLAAPLARAQLLNKQARLGTNLEYVADFSNAVVFVDQFKQSRAWVSQDLPQREGSRFDNGLALDLTAEGWVASLQPGQAAVTLMLSELEGHQPAGTYVCLYDGQGQIEFPWNARGAESAGRIEFQVTSDGPGIKLSLTATDPADPIRNIRVIMPGFEQTYRQQVFYPPFVESLAIYRVIRFQHWMYVNSGENDSRRWSDRTTPASVRQTGPRGVALEHIIDLCNRLGADPWFNLPHVASDDYIEGFAEMVRDRLDPRLQSYVEYSNEVWNYLFAQSDYLKAKGAALSDDPHEASLRYQAQRSVEIFSIWETVFGSTERFVRVLSVQHLPWSGRTVMDWQQAYRHADALAFAPYFGAMLGVSLDVDDGGLLEQARTMSVEQILDYCQQDIARNRALSIEMHSDAAARGLRVIAYEGGQHLVGFGWQTETGVAQKFEAANRHARMRGLYLDDLRGWAELGGGLFVTYRHMGRYGEQGCFGVMEYLDQDSASSPKYQGLLDYLALAIALPPQPEPQPMPEPEPQPTPEPDPADGWREPVCDPLKHAVLEARRVELEQQIAADSWQSDEEEATFWEEWEAVLVALSFCALAAGCAFGCGLI